MSSNSARNPTPHTVIWNLGSRPPKPGDKAVWEQQRFFYWLYIRNVSSTDFKPYDMSSGNSSPQLVLGAHISNNLIYVNRPYDFLGFLLKDGMIDFAQPVTVAIRSADSKSWDNLTQIMVSRNVEIKKQTLHAYGDINYIFSAAVWLEKEGANWKAKTGNDWFLPNSSTRPSLMRARI
jgi:hypothetical protein